MLIKKSTLKMATTPVLLVALALCSVGLFADISNSTYVASSVLDSQSAAGGFLQGCKNQVACPAACVQPTCIININPVTGIVSCAAQGGAGGVAGGGVIGTCKLFGLGCTVGSPCGASQAPVCIVVGVNCAGVCVNNGAGPAGC